MYLLIYKDTHTHTHRTTAEKRMFVSYLNLLLCHFSGISSGWIVSQPAKNHPPWAIGIDLLIIYWLQCYKPHDF